MKDFPEDPIRQHNKLVAAFCDDLFDMCMNGGTGTPRANRVAEISRQIREAGDSKKAPASNHGD